ncbi:MAG: polysaccharide biosynthesis protein [Lachnospiraceae bacterium]|nr:polysaccharide biosynthesis protein [Lachnospiraceae bacterium]
MATEQTKKNNNNFLIQGSILAIAGILVRIIGLAYRIPLVRIVGDEGMGYYSVAYEIYAIILLLSSYSLPLSVSKMVSAKLAGDDYLNANRIFKVSLIYATIVGALCFAFLWFTADWFANVFYHLPLCKYALISLAPTVWIMTYLGVMRGFYQGQSTMVPTAVSQILEQIVNALVSVGAAWWLCQMALNAAKGDSVASAWGAAGGTIGTGAGALTALIVLIILYIRGRKEWNENVVRSENAGIKKESYKEISKILFFTVIPVILSTAVYNITNIVDAEIFTSTMVEYFGNNASSVAADWGVFTGKFKTLANIPIAIANSLSSSLIPVMAAAAAAKNKKGVEDGISLALRYTVLISLPASVGLTILGGPIVSLLFGKSDLATTMTLIGSFGVLFYSVSTVTNAVLQGNNYMRIPVINALIALIVHVAVIFVLMRVFNMGIKAIVIGYMLFGLFMCILNSFAITKKISYRADVSITYLKPLLCSIVMGAATIVIRLLLEKLTGSNFIITFGSIIVAVIVYVIMIIITGTITKKELKRFPVIKRFIR